MWKKGFLASTSLLCIVFFSIALSSPGDSTPSSAQTPFEITVSTLPAGFASYVMGVAMAEIINNNSPWLEAVAIEGRGPAEHMKTLVRKPEKRTHYLFFNTPWDIWEAKKQEGTYKGFPFDYDEFRFVCLLGVAGNGLCVIDPNIKTVKDLVGKKVIFDSGKGKGRQLVYDAILKEAGVPLDKIQFQYSRGKPAADNLRDGLVDAIYSGHVLTELPNIFSNSPYQAELVATKNVHFISLPEKEVMAFKKKTGHPLAMVHVPPKMLGPLQTEPCCILIKPLAFAAHISMPDRVVTEILRVVYENVHKFKEYTPAGAILTRETMASLSVGSEAYHPAAVRFFEEKGIRITGFEQQ